MLKKILNKYNKIILYLFFGVCTTIVNIISYYVMAHLLHKSVMFSTVVAWILAVLFAYITNRKWVFDSKANSSKEIFNEIISFFACRLATGVVDWLMMFILVEKIGLNDIVIKIIANIIVIILNYVASKLIIFTDKKRLTDNKELIIYASFILVAFIFLLNSPLHIWRGANSGTDSSVFKTVALMMQHGFMPYKDTFDHKGPLIYIYNYIGNIISYYRGIWIIELISLSVTLCYLYKIARLKCSNTISYIISILSLTVLFNYFEGGNLTEEYALPFIAYSLYIFLDYLINSKVNKLRLILCGLSCGAVLLLRPNMIGTWFVFCLAILIDCIKKKKYNELLKLILYFAIGLLIILVPVITWIIINGALDEFWNSYITFNSTYTEASTNSIRIIDMWNSLFNFINNNIILATFVIMIISIKDNKKNIIYLIYIIVSLLLICLSGREYPHYMMIFIPVIVYPFSILFDFINKNTKKNYFNIASTLIIIYLMSNIIIPTWIETVKDIPKYYFSKDKNNITESVQKRIDLIKEKTTENDKISVYGNLNIYYVLSNRMHATKYSFQYPIGEVLPSIMDEYFDQLGKEKAKLIIVSSNRYDNRIKEFLNNNNYKLIHGNPNNKEVAIFELNN